MIKAKHIINILSIGVILGFFIGFISAISSITKNQFFQYKMFRLFSLTLQTKLNQNIFYIVAGLLIISILGFLIRKITKSDKNLFIKNMLIAIIIIILSIFLFIVFFKGNFSDHDIPHLINVFIARFGNLVKNKISLSEFFIISQQTRKFVIIFFLLIGSVVLISLLLHWILKKVKWEKILKIIEVKFFRISAFTLIILMLILNLSIFIERTINSEKRLNLVVIVIDALRKDHLGIYGYKRETSPNIDNFAKKAVVFKNAISQCSWTNPSIASLFSSLCPSVHGVISYDEKKADYFNYKIATIAEILKEKGYTTGAFVANHFINKKLKFNQGFDVFDSINSKYKPLASELNEKALKWIAKNKNKNFFVYMHYMDAHGPYEPPEPYDNFFKSNEDRQMSDEEYSKLMFLSVGKEKDNNDLNYYIDKYDGEIRYVDYHIGKIIKKLGEYDLFDNTIVIVTSDHGEAFFEHGFCGHGYSLYNEEIYIPLIVKFPKDIKISEINNDKVGLIDISATMLNILSCKFPHKTNGKNLLSFSNKMMSNNLIIFSEEISLTTKGPPKIAMLKDNFKAIYMVATQQITELYNLDKDKFEKENLINVYPDKYQELTKDIEAFQRERLREKIKLGIKNSSFRILDEEMKQKLKSLGYLK